MGVGLINYRLGKKLPIKTNEDRKYLKERFYWIVDAFKNQLFTSENEISTDTLFEKMFDFLEKGIPNRDLSDVFEFIAGMGYSMAAVGYGLRMNLTVTQEFFSGIFYRLVDQRFHRQSDYISERVPFLCDVLERAGIEDVTVHKIVEAGLIYSETSTKFYLPIQEYYTRITEEIVKQCQAIGVEMDVDKLISDSE